MALAEGVHQARYQLAAAAAAGPGRSRSASRDRLVCCPWADTDWRRGWGMSTRLEPMPALLDRQRERAVLDGLLGDLRSGRGWALMVRGEAGVGKSALLEYVTGAAAGMRV